MNAVPNRWRRLAVSLARHAARVLPGARSPWAEAMRRELDYIDDDPAAVRWALGCVLVSYKARLAERPRFGTRPGWRHVAAGGAAMLLIGLALQARAGSQTEPPQPSFDESTCHVSGASPEPCPRTGCRASHHDATRSAQDRGRFTHAQDASCTDRHAPIRLLEK
jgi:hypothetical protein